MVDAPFGWLAASDGRLQRSNHKAGLHQAADGIADYLAREGIEDSGEVDEAAGNGDIGQIRNPKLVQTLKNHILGQVREDRAVMRAVGGNDIAAALFWL